MNDCVYCQPTVVTGDNYWYNFGPSLPLDSDDNVDFCIRFSKTNPNDITLHCETYSLDDDGNEYCEKSGDSSIKYCPMCGRQLVEEN